MCAVWSVVITVMIKTIIQNINRSSEINTSGLVITITSHGVMTSQVLCNSTIWSAACSGSHRKITKIPALLAFSERHSPTGSHIKQPVPDVSPWLNVFFFNENQDKTESVTRKAFPCHNFITWSFSYAELNINDNMTETIPKTMFMIYVIYSHFSHIPFR